MEENKENADNVTGNPSVFRWRKLLNIITLIFFAITIALLIYIVILYVPLKEQCLRCSCNNSYIDAYVMNISGFLKNMNATP